MSQDEVIKYATGYVKGKISIVTLERESKGMWWVRTTTEPYSYHCDLFTWKYFAERKFWKLVDIYGLKVTEFEPFNIDKEQILKALINKNPVGIV